MPEVLEPLEPRRHLRGEAGKRSVTVEPVRDGEELRGRPPGGETPLVADRADPSWCAASAGSSALSCVVGRA
jgi:hypothetical protein